MVTRPQKRQGQFMRGVRNRPALRRKGSVVVFGQLLLVASGIAVGGGIAYLGHEYVVNNSTFRLRRLVLDGVPGELHAAVRQQLASADNANLLLADLEPFQARLREIPQIHAATLRRVLPDTVEVLVELRSPWGRLRTTDGTYLVSSDGVVLAAATDNRPDLPRLRLDVDLGSTLDERRRLPEGPGERWFGAAVRIVDWMSTIAPAELEQAEILLADEGVFMLMGPWRILLGDATELEVKTSNLRAVLSGSPPPPGSVVDLRFRDMVVVRDPEPTDETRE